MRKRLICISGSRGIHWTIPTQLQIATVQQTESFLLQNDPFLHVGNSQQELTFSFSTPPSQEGIYPFKGKPDHPLLRNMLDQTKSPFVSGSCFPHGQPDAFPISTTEQEWNSSPIVPSQQLVFHELKAQSRQPGQKPSPPLVYLISFYSSFLLVLQDNIMVSTATG